MGILRMCLLWQYMKSLTATLHLYYGPYIGIIMGNKIIFTVLYIRINMNKEQHFLGMIVIGSTQVFNLSKL